jgi:prepilin-type N-terminal cleavage/methylation domain-containing protein
MTTTPTSRGRVSGQTGFSATELVVVVAVIGILMAASMPLLFSAIRASAVRAGAEQMATVLGQARQMAIKDNTSICVTASAAGLQYWKKGLCGDLTVGPDGTYLYLWIGPGTEGDGYIRLANNITVTPPAPTVVFTYIGTANVATYTVTSQDGQTLKVSVEPSGRIYIKP